MNSDCSNFRDLFPEALTGQLAPDEQCALNTHFANCPKCAKAYQDLQTLESDMTALFAATQPDALFESRILTRLRFSSPKRLHPLVQKIAVGLAASIVLGGFGFAAQSMLEKGKMPFWAESPIRVKSASNLRQISQAILGYDDDAKPTANTQVAAGKLVVPASDSWHSSASDPKPGNANSHDEDKENVLYGNVHTDFQRSPFVGVQRDNIYVGRGLKSSPPHDANDSILLPTDDQPTAGEKTSAGLPAQAGHYYFDIQGKDQHWGMKGVAVEGKSQSRYDLKATKVPVSGQVGAADLERIAGERKKESVATLTQRSRQLTSEGRYDEALGVVDQILVLDKNNDYATGVRPLINDRKRLHEQSDQKQEQPVAGVGILRYPEKWPDLSAPREDVMVAAQLDRKLPEIRFDNAQLGDTVDFLRDITGRDIWVNWKALEAAGVKKDAPITARFRDLKTTEALQQLLADAGGGKLGYTVKDGLITISTKDDLAKQDANAPAPGTQPANAGNQTQEIIQTKIIRNGEVEFEVDSFDSSVATVSKIVNEERGYIGTTSSEKLPNGKVKGVLIVRVPPGNLDTLVLKLRGLGDLKRQNLSANDVTKQYYDLSSELRAARAMQERLLEIIKTGNAQVKDLLSVEKELATWRGKIEKLEGEVRYYDNLVSLSTLNIALTERDIRTAAAIREIETADAGIEVSDVETARASAIASIEEAKGRIIEAELKKLDAGQFAAKVIADVPAENAGAVIDRLKQIGKVARLEISRKQTTPDNSSPQPGAKVERGDTHIVASFYNLANVAPRQTVTMQMASDDVAKTYAAILAQIEKANGRVVTSNLQQPRPDETSGTIQFELPANVADQNLQQLQSSGLVLQMTASENPDTANVTSAKRGFNLTLISSRAIAPRQTLNLTTEANDVAQTSASLTTFVQSIGGRIVDTNQSTATDGSSNASLRVEVPVSKLSELMGKIESSTKIRAQQSALRTQVPEGPAARALVDLKLQTPDAILSSENGFFPSLRRGLSTSVAGLLWSLQLIIIGVCLIAPWALLLWGGIKFWKRRRAT